MNNLIKYFYPKDELSYFEKLKTIFFILQIYIGILVALSLSISELISPGDNFFASFFSALSIFLFFIFSLFLLKKKGITIAGNIFSIVIVVLLLIWINILTKDINPIYKYIQGFYSIFIFLILGILFASRPIILINAGLIIISTTRVFIFAITNTPENVEIFTTGYITHSVALLSITIIIYFANKFTESTIEKLEEETKNIKLKNQELATSEEEIRATNEELIVTTDALKENYDELIIAKEKVEENNRLKIRFLNNMSHEIRTPMNGITGFSHLLRDQNLTEEIRNNFIDIINNSSAQLLRIIDDILEISKLETKQHRIIENKVCINELLSELFSIFNIKAQENNIQLNLEKGLSDIESTVKIDDSKLLKILGNLIDNALKFTESGYVKFGYQYKNNKLEFYVEDTGIGINFDKQELIFERFMQEDNNKEHLYGGLGLGLSIAKENIKLLNGEINVESKKGKGAKFFVTIPYKPTEAENIQKQSQNDNSKSFTKEYSILIAEDDNVNYLYLEELLKILDLKFIIHRAINGDEAINICKNNSEIKLVLMDLKMPKISGFDATKQIKLLRPEILIIAQTAFSTQEDKNKAISAGCDDFITKPISEEDLNTVLRKHLVV